MNTERICYGCFAEKEPGLPCPYCGFNENEEQPYLALPLGAVLNGRYLVGKVLGIGGFGITYLGYDLTLQIKVAIKEYMPSALATRHPDHYSVALTGRVEEDYQYGMERFLDEAKILAKLQNTPHIVSVQNYFKENSTAYFVMEYIDGMSLKGYLAKNGERISYEQAISILQPVMEALIQVHARNLLHRDISPDNIYITAGGESRLLDFGAARFALGDGKSVSVILKHGYAPEEQYSSHGNQGPWTDVYAMGATFYRCITGQLPPDSVERIHGDSLKRPSELGVRVPANVEQAIMKALAVRTEDRFSNMEAFISALNGRASVQDQVADGIGRRARAAARGQSGSRQGTYGQSANGQGSYGQSVNGQGGYGQPAYQQSPYQQSMQPGGGAGKTSPFSRLLSYMKANPVIAGVSIGGLVLVIALCIILPIALSGGKKETASGGGGGGGSSTTVQPSTGEEKPTIGQDAPAEMVTRDLGDIHATIDIPSDYEMSTDDGLNYIKGETNGKLGCSIMISYSWNEVIPMLGSWEPVGPIYTLADVEAQKEAIVAYLARAAKDYQIVSAGAEQVGDANGYQIRFETTSKEGHSGERVLMAVEGHGYGCYFIYAVFSKGDDATKTEVDSITHSFVSTGAPESTYKAYCAAKGAVKVIIDNALAEGRVYDETVSVGSAGAYAELTIYPTQEAEEAGVGSTAYNAGNVEVMFAEQLALSSPEEVIQYMRKKVGNLGASSGDTYTMQRAGVEWLCVDSSTSEMNFRTAAAMIDGKCFAVSCTYTDVNDYKVDKLYNQAIDTVRYYKK